MSDESSEAQDLPAGDFAVWLGDTQSAQQDRPGADVPCGGCTACCTSSYFIHIGPDETETLARIDPELLFDAPGRPHGHRLMGFDESGHCPMLVDGGCSIYVDRPQTCRTYDCRVFAATSLAAGGDDKARITQRVRRWRFSYPQDRGHAEQTAVLAAARFLSERAECLPTGFVPRNPTQLAILAVKVYKAFLDHSEAGNEHPGEMPDAERARAIVAASERFDS
jgi:hypothetical protein